jgi:hypothetical protein
MSNRNRMGVGLRCHHPLDRVPTIGNDKSMKYRHLLILASAILMQKSGAEEIEAKDGRKIQAAIVSATRETVVIRRSGASEQSLKRETLSLETNNLIDAFLKKQRDSKDKDLSNFEMKIGGKLHRISLWLPNRRVPLNPNHSAIQISGGSGANHLSMAFSSNATLETAEKAMNQAKQSAISMASNKPKAVAEKAAKTINVEKKQYGEWEGYILTGWSDRENSEGPASDVLMFSNKAYFVKDKIGISFTFMLGDGGAFTRRNMDAVIQSVEVEMLE